VHPRRLIPAHFAAAAASSCLALAVQVAFWRAAGLNVGTALLASQLIVLSLVHFLAAIFLAGRRQDRPWAVTLLVTPILLAALPAADRFGGLVAVAAALCIAGTIVLAASYRVGGRGTPLLAATIGAATGAALAAAVSGLQFEGTPVFTGRLPVVVLGLFSASALGLLLGAVRFLPFPVRLPRTRTSLGIAAVALGLSVGVGSFRAAKRVPPAPPAGARSASASSRPPVVLIVLDTLRADHLQAYGSGRPTMPNLEQFAHAHATRIERSLANAPSSLESHASMFTGLYSAHHAAHRGPIDDPSPPTYSYPLPEDIPTLSGLLRRAGYWSVGISANAGPLSERFGLGRGFASYDATASPKQKLGLINPWRGALFRRWPLAFGDRLAPFSSSELFELGVPYRRAAAIVDAGLTALDRAGNDPLFLFLNFMDAHYPYRPPNCFAETFPGTPRPGMNTIEDSQQVLRQAMLGQREITTAEKTAWIAAYDSGVRYLDRELGRLLDRLQQHPRFGDMLIIVMSDHGEGFGEHGLFRHSTSLYDEMLRVPLFIKPGANRPSGFQPGGVLPGPFQSVDVFPTVLEAAGLPIPGRIDGFPWGRGRHVSLAEAYVHQPAVQHWGPRFARELQAAEADGWKLIVSSAGDAELYDLARDPGERVNVAARNSEQVERLGSLLRSGLTPRRNPARPRSDSDEVIRSLRSLGYLQ
jgi:arylsulfatase A-like enzyme